MATKKIHWPTIRRCWPVWTLGTDPGLASPAGVARDRPPVIIEPDISDTQRATSPSLTTDNKEDICGNETCSVSGFPPDPWALTPFEPEGDMGESMETLVSTFRNVGIEHRGTKGLLLVSHNDEPIVRTAICLYDVLTGCRERGRNILIVSFEFLISNNTHLRSRE
jgi:hypothetical protein